MKSLPDGPFKAYMGTFPDSPAPRLGFFGGTFDPPHNGHLEIAQAAIQKAKLDKLLFCPAHQAPLRTEPPFFSALDRLAMVQAICQNRSKMEPYDAEIKHGITRYSYETIEEVKSNFPGSDLFLILGDDQFSRLAEWKKVELLAKSVHFLVFARQSRHQNKPDMQHLDYSFMDNALINLSSTDIRKHLHLNHLPESSIPPEVASYIRNHNLLPLQ